MNEINVHNQLIEEEAKEIEDNPELLKRLYTSFSKQSLHATSRHNRYENLMQRKSVKKLDAKKVSRAVRRMSAAAKELEQATNAIEHISRRLTAINNM